MTCNYIMNIAWVVIDETWFAHLTSHLQLYGGPMGLGGVTYKVYMTFSPAMITRNVRIHPLGKHLSVALKFELYGRSYGGKTNLVHYVHCLYKGW